MEIFFVISGFVMMATSAPYEGAPGGWLEFAKRRIARIVPLYWVATLLKALISFVGASVVLHNPFDLGSTVLSLLFVPFKNSFGRIEPVLGVGWTLNFEMVFYALFTLALALRCDPLKMIAPILILASAGSLFADETWPAPALFYLSPVVLNFAAGMAIAKWAMRGPTVRPVAAAVAVIVGFALLVSGVQLPLVPYPIGLCIGSTLVVGGVVNAEPLLKKRMPAWLVFLGAASYSLYLFHPIIAPAVPDLLKRFYIEAPTVAVPACVVVAVCASAGIYQWGRSH